MHASVNTRYYGDNLDVLRCYVADERRSSSRTGYARPRLRETISVSLMLIFVTSGRGIRAKRKPGLEFCFRHLLCVLLVAVSCAALNDGPTEDSDSSFSDAPHCCDRRGV